MLFGNLRFICLEIACPVLKHVIVCSSGDLGNWKLNNFVKTILMNKKDIKIIFWGSSEFSVPSLLTLIKEFNVVGVIAETSKQSGRGHEVKTPRTIEIAKEHGIKTFQVENFGEDFSDELKELKPDLNLTCSYGKLIPDKVLNLPTHGSINVHPSLLPKYRGCAPIQGALLNGDSKTGVSIILMDSELDSGDIIATRKEAITESDNFTTLCKRLSLISAEMLKTVVPEYINDEVNYITQEDEYATYIKKIEKKDGLINWNTPVLNISNLIRAFNEWPVAYTFYKEKKLEIKKANPTRIANAGAHTVGEVIERDKKYYVRCKSGYLELLSVKLEGKNEVDIKSFVNGHQDLVGSILS